MDKIQSLLQKELNRKEFLSYIGLALLAVVGVTSFLTNLNSSISSGGHKSFKSPGQPSSAGYGSSPYGK